MTVIATASNPRFTVSRVDIDRPGPTFTIDTLRDLHARAARRRAVLHHRRRRAGPDPVVEGRRELFELAHFIGVTGPGYDWPTPGLPAGRVTLSRCPAMAISSTDCRGGSPGRPVWYLVPDGVVQYIAKQLPAAAPDQHKRAETRSAWCT